MATTAQLIPVAAGKGGVGKSFLAANLAVALAGLGHRTIAVDMDLGGANLYSFLGLPNRFPGIGDYLQARSGELASLLVPTGVSGLQFLPGDGKTPFMANIAYAQKVKLLNNIRKLPADYILMDLGAGSSFNALDFFAVSERGLLVTTPEPPAIMNMLVFLKNFLLRRISRALAGDHDFRGHLREVCRRPMDGQIPSVPALAAEIAKEDPVAGSRVAAVCELFRPRIVFNLGEHPDELKLTGQISNSLETVLGLRADYFGFIFYDPMVRRSVREQKPLFSQWPDSMAASEILRIARRIEKYWCAPIADSAERLEKGVRETFTAAAS